MLEKYTRGKKGSQGTPSGGVSELLLVGVFGLGALIAKPDLISNYNTLLRVGFLLLAIVGIYRSNTKLGG